MGYITVYEQAFLGIGTSQWVIIILAILCFFELMAFLVLYGKLGPTQGYLYAAFGKQDDKNIGIVIQNHSITIKKLKYFSGVFENLGLTWIAKKSEQHTFGECRAEIITDFWGLTMDPKVNAGALEFINAWNSDTEFEMFSGDSDYSWLPCKAERKPIEDFETLYEAINKCPPDSEIRIRAFSYVPIYTLQKYFPKNLKASDLTGYIEAMRKVVDEKTQNAAVSYLPMICFVIGIILGAGLIFLAKM